MFNFEINKDVVNASSKASSKILKAGQIHRVKLIEVKEEKIDVKARAAQGNYPAREAYTDTVLTIVTANEEGESYTDRFFTPDADAATRRINDKGKTTPSQFEQVQNKLTQYLIAFRPQLIEDIKTGKESFKAKNWAGYRSLVAKALLKAVDKKEVFLKLLKNTSGYAETPRYPAAMGTNKETGELAIFTGSVFIHHDQSLVEFSKYELDLMASVANAKPTSMGKGSEDDDLSPDLDDNDMDELDLEEEDDDLPL